MPPASGWICWNEAFPAYKWFSSEDATATFPTVTCRKVENPPEGYSLREWYNLWKLAGLVEAWPW